MPSKAWISLNKRPQAYLATNPALLVTYIRDCYLRYFENLLDSKPQLLK